MPRGGVTDVSLMAERGRKPGFKMTDEHRLKIKNSNILNALIEHVTEGREMSPSQVTAGLGLLRKVMPDLQATQHSGDRDNPLAVEVSASKEQRDAAVAAALATKS
jgi:hypothetical protein